MEGNDDIQFLVKEQVGRALLSWKKIKVTEAGDKGTRVC